MTAKKEHKILITEAQPIVVNGLTKLFVAPDYQVVGIAQNGTELLKLLENNIVDTIFIDIKLPQTNIYRLIKDIVVLYPTTKIIVFTNYVMPKLVQDVMEFGVHAYISKSAELDEILESIDRVHKGEHFIGPSVFKHSTSLKIQDKVITSPDENYEKFAALTEREVDVTILLGRGLNSEEIAEKLYLPQHKIDQYTEEIMKKCNLDSTNQLVKFASVLGLV